jgi:DNA helicase-2/ATP-dependent DNA helicase PcrA
MFGKNIHHNNILAVTFTNKAANEMKERLVKISGEIQEMGMTSPTETAQQATGDGGVDDFLAFIEATAPAYSSPQLTLQSFPWIGTFHSIFLKILKQDIEHL